MYYNSVRSDYSNGHVSAYILTFKLNPNCNKLKISINMAVDNYSRSN